MLLLVFPSSSLSKEILIWLGRLCLLGTGTARGLLLTYSHARTHTLGTTLSSLPWHKTGKDAKIQRVKNAAFSPWAPRERLHTVCRSVSQFPDRRSIRLPSPVACSAALTPGNTATLCLRLAVSSDRAPGVKRGLSA